MSSTDKALQTQLANIETRTGKTLAQLYAVLAKAGLEKHGEMVKMLKQDLGMGHGDANTLVHTWRAQNQTPHTGAAAADDPLAAIYTGKKADLRPLHEALMKKVEKFGAFEIAPKKAYVSLRRNKQFAMVGPGTKGRLEIGINLKDEAGDERFVAQKPGGMCQLKVWLTDAAEIDAELLAVLKRAFAAAG
ncbi:MAG: DUF4287 domain-containing protein [Planctomycetes bacterium]|nr:DUF4287 domain-containing protein [Planctomycetota bacterium]